ncbi:cytochrome b562 [Aliivibrio salmonicida]|jgi:soluble cytochrome b562|uniref:Cytochrome b562 n=1 Tax=Aliivibrio salmonicida (strain LFI1238) TaxID=316275 RepID=B6EQR5_ALISL|nr:cytochrome b562 [Aliivibrio salmonicida]AZL86459.1 cytochrome b562 [Aliivibrio salmonicida]CAQ81043.1 cytochrome b562 [Aliivibrio salmonicida LFI1238]
MRTLFLTLALTFSAGVAANITTESTEIIGAKPTLITTPVDTKAAMKDMMLAFKQSEDASSIDEMTQSVMRLDALIDYLKQENFSPEKQELYQEGFNKLSVSVDRVKSELAAGNLEQAKDTLNQVDDLRSEYHKKRNPSIWSKIFG